MRETTPLDPLTERWLSALKRNGAHPDAVYLARRVIDRARSRFPELPPVGFSLGMGETVRLHFEQAPRWATVVCAIELEAKRLSVYERDRRSRCALAHTGPVAKLADIDRFLETVGAYLTGKGQAQ